MNGKNQAKDRILVVDDLEENVTVMSRFLQLKRFNVDCANDGEQALKKISDNPPDLVLLDLIMPKVDGYAVCRQLKNDKSTRHIPIIIITGKSDSEANVMAINAGADDFLTKPLDSTLLEAKIRRSLKEKRLQDRLLQYRQRLENQNALLDSKVRERTAELERSWRVTVFTLAKLAESRDNETGEHLDRIRLYVKVIARKLQESPRFKSVVTDQYIEELYQSCPLHDIGKVGIPDHILLKPDKLEPEEFEIMKTHSAIGGETLEAAVRESGGNSFLGMGRDIAFYHHERWDGDGYPAGLRGEAIPLSARIVAVADVYDALTSKRPYKEAFSHERAKKIMLEGRGSHFDPEILDAFNACEEDVNIIRTECLDSGKPLPLEEMSVRLRANEVKKEAIHANAQPPAN